ncbi:MAG: RluA family pseudouridine synthase [Candidatus Brocadiales bacterium]
MPQETTEKKAFELIVKRRSYVGRRLDKYIAARFQQYSRSFIQRLIKDGSVKVGGQPAKSSYVIKYRDAITLELPVLEEEKVQPEDLPLDIIHEDDYLMVVNKPPDMVVHPAPGNMSGTLVNALAFHVQKLSSVGGPMKAGIVHRLDRDTSGVMLVVKSDLVHSNIAEQFEKRKVHKEYVALVEGDVELDSDLVELPIGRHAINRLKMAVRHDEGRAATSVYEVMERFGDFTLVKVMPKTGRTHQIRVHMKAIGHPIVADADYNRRDCLYRSEIFREEQETGEQPVLDRQALHAYGLEFYHPALKKRVSFQAELPDDIMAVLKLLRERGPVKRRRRRT